MSERAIQLFNCTDLCVSVAGRCLVKNLGLAIGSGEFVAVLGRNGSGKSLTLHTFAGLRDAEAGRVLVNGVDVADGNRAHTARQLALLPQHVDDIFPSSVLDTVMIGRHPHIGPVVAQSPPVDARRRPAAGAQ